MSKKSIYISNVFNRNYNTTKRIVINRGGTRAGKTYAICQLLAKWLLSGEVRRGQHIEEGVASVVRKTLPALKASAQKDFESILDEWGVLGTQVTKRIVDREYIYKKRRVEFFSVDDQQKVRGRKRNILFANEANELNYQSDFFQLNIRTEVLVFIDFNPSDPYNWVKLELEDKRAHLEKDVETIKSTYKDNPFISDQLAKEIESITDPDLRKVYVDGEYGLVKGLVFPKVNIIDQLPKGLRKHGLGLDFGYTNDPAALCECGLHQGGIYVHEWIYSTGLTNKDLHELILQAGLGKRKIYADSAEPKSIEELKRRGLFVKATRKGKDSIRYGINLIKQYPLFITATSVNLLKEQKLYKWHSLSDGTFTNKPIDNFNHAWDCVRYWAIMNLRKNQGVLASG